MYFSICVIFYVFFCNAYTKDFTVLFQIQAANGEVTITNDGATILKQMNVLHPAAKMVRIKNNNFFLLRLKFGVASVAWASKNIVLFS